MSRDQAETRCKLLLQRRKYKTRPCQQKLLLRALGNVYYAQKATGSDCTATGALVLRIHALPPKGGRLALDMDEYRLARNALNQLRTRRIAEGGYTDAVDDALCRFL